MNINLSPGSSIINSQNNECYGIVVDTIPNNKIVVFRLDKNIYPVFSKIKNEPHN